MSRLMYMYCILDTNRRQKRNARPCEKSTSADTLPIPQPPLTHTLDARPTDIVARQDAPPARQTRHESSAVPRCGLVRPTTLPWAPGRLQFCSILSLDFRPAPTLPTLVIQLHLNEILIPTATAVKRVKSARGLAPNCRVQVQLHCLENSSHEAREAPWPLLSACAKSARVAPSTDSAPRRPTEKVWLWSKQKGGCAVRPMTVWRGGVIRLPQTVETALPKCCC